MNPMDDSLLGDESFGARPPRPGPQPMHVEQVEVRLTGTARVAPDVWEAHVTRLEFYESPEGLAEFRAALRDLDLRDEADQAWSFDGTGWWRWDGYTWIGGRPTSSLVLSSISLDVPVPHVPDAARNALGPAPSGLPAPGFTSTHRVPVDGMPVWTEPDPTAAPTAVLDPNLELMAVEWRPDGWTRIVCSNMWSGWVDGRLLIPAS
jgi:hypothetical protein